MKRRTWKGLLGFAFAATLFSGAAQAKQPRVFPRISTPKQVTKQEGPPSEDMIIPDYEGDMQAWALEFLQQPDLVNSHEERIGNEGNIPPTFRGRRFGGRYQTRNGMLVHYSVQRGVRRLILCGARDSDEGNVDAYRIVISSDQGNRSVTITVEISQNMPDEIREGIVEHPLNYAMLAGAHQMAQPEDCHSDQFVLPYGGDDLSDEAIGIVASAGRYVHENSE